MRILDYTPRYRFLFEQLNRAWVEKYFETEPMDELILSKPEETILQKGGKILFVEYDNQIIGTIALIFVSDGVYELAKMAVDERFHGIGAGKFLCHSAIKEARKINAKKLILFTNSKLETAIGIYHKYGFQAVPLHGQEYSRADIKMELSLETKPAAKWFERQFAFNSGIEQFPALTERLKRTTDRLPEVIKKMAESDLNCKQPGKWSIKEHIGHLWLLEPLWQKRFLEIKEQNTATMSPSDLRNAATDLANFNQYKADKIIDDFTNERTNTLCLLEGFSEKDLRRSLCHPRLQQQMSVTDLLYFVAEHDDHHLSAIFTIRESRAPSSDYPPHYE